MTILESYSKHCDRLKANFSYRSLNLTCQQNFLDFTSNDYLGLSRHPEVIKRAQQYAQLYGVGGLSSRLLKQEQTIYSNLEAKIAFAKKKETALIFNSGYQANSTILAALLNKHVLGADPLVFSDRLNHASLHHGCKLAGVRQKRFQHLDMDHLSSLLDSYKNAKQPKFIISESVFSMDGDIANIKSLVELAHKYGAFLYIDEAHATGVLGANGYGLTPAYAEGIHMVMGTFSKTVGASGAYVACSHLLRNYLINTCSGFIYSTALSPMIIGAVDAAWDLVPSLSHQRSHLLSLAQTLRQELNKHGYDTGSSTTQIVPVILKDVKKTLLMQSYLAQKDIKVSAIRPPTVPPDTARLRISLSASHKVEDISALLTGIQQCK